MKILSTLGWKDYELFDSGNGMRFERFGPYKTVRPDPQAIWQPKQFASWQQADVQYIRTVKDQGQWKFKRAIPEKWKMSWKDVSFWARLTSFKHTGVFPEQSLQWEWMENVIANRVKQSHKNKIATLTPSPRNDNPKVLNLFAYTGIASIVAAQAGAAVTHVDSSKPSISWARENQMISGLKDKPIRWILDDCLKFVEREIRRGATYDGIIMDPPVYGHGANGQIWKFSEHFPKLMADVAKLLSKTPLFVIVNAYAISSSSLMLENVLRDYLPTGSTEVGELCLEETIGKRLLSTGMFVRWSK
ncbi:MAG TPA: class I SAM-dependent methyltransferase [Patescibacteria group bacterium]|nr:class I SAM-dependent methyltransferase [Patescibacteria group bacterium]